ncbi:hypothetical protein [Streptomyces cucumeris]|uniref:hypothetical protein n=1 Tax=Streptomyces cucumeris TaxID=2962890 RepID=UPI0020C880DE|nr:hypothetical protein [Streptomyces sp. NEAU-Y11]MCP9205524.1 hypothetical protein [Streptomyces sp. NEAU-Y11]
MTSRSDGTEDQDLRASENVIMNEPATVQSCNGDYRAGVADRATFDRLVRNENRGR